VPVWWATWLIYRHVHWQVFWFEPLLHVSLSLSPYPPPPPGTALTLVNTFLLEILAFENPLLLGISQIRDTCPTVLTVTLRLFRFYSFNLLCVEFYSNFRSAVVTVTRKSTEHVVLFPPRARSIWPLILCTRCRTDVKYSWVLSSYRWYFLLPHNTYWNFILRESYVFVCLLQYLRYYM